MCPFPSWHIITCSCLRVLTRSLFLSLACTFHEGRINVRVLLVLTLWLDGGGERGRGGRREGKGERGKKREREAAGKAREGKTRLLAAAMLVSVNRRRTSTVSSDFTVTEFKILCNYNLESHYLESSCNIKLKLSRRTQRHGSEE